MEKLIFDFDAMNRIFPFHFVIGQDLTFTQIGKSLMKLDSTIRGGNNWKDHFTMLRPGLEKNDFQHFSDICDHLVLMINHKTRISFQGQWEKVDEGKALMFVGAPWFGSSQELNESGLALKDFAPHNPMINLLHKLNMEELVVDELKNAVAKISKQKDALIVSEQKLKSVTTSLEESNRRYEYMSKATSEAIWDWNILSGEVYQGIGFNKSFGYDSTQETIHVDAWSSRLHPDDLDRVMKSIENGLRSNENYWSCQYRYKKKDNSYAIVSDNGYIVRDAYGNAIRMVGALLDISKQKEEELQMILLQSVVKNSQDGVVITLAQDGYPIVYINESFTKLTGYDSNEVMGKNPRFLQGPESNKDSIEKIKNCLRQGSFVEVETINYKKNGEKYWVSLSINPIRNEKDEITHWVAIERDITPFQEMSEEVEKQKQFVEDILGNIPTDIAVFDEKHRYIFLNKYAIKNEELRSWMIGKDDFDYCKFRNIDNTQALRRRELFNKTVESKEKHQWIDEHTDKEGNTQFILRNLYPHFEKNKLKFVIGYGIDITERKQIEIQLSEALHAVKKTNSELEQFAYVASHDLQEPLRMVTSFLTQLEKKYAEKLDERANEYIHFAVDGAKRMRQIILDLLEFSRVGKQNEQKKELDINDIVAEIKLLHHEQIKEWDAIITTKNLPVIIGHRTPIRQVFQNIIGNSLKYHREGVPPEIHVEAIPLKDRWQFKISDNGIGIENEYFDKIFEIFQRLHNKEEYSGTGIGLAITKKIIENLGGKIWVNSVYGKGSNFYFTIPF
jgi:PAS domain S-box-containing protein